jgi:hypothetical protein
MPSVTFFIDVLSVLMLNIVMLSVVASQEHVMAKCNKNLTIVKLVVVPQLQIKVKI